MSLAASAPMMNGYTWTRVVVTLLLECRSSLCSDSAKPWTANCAVDRGIRVPRVAPPDRPATDDRTTMWPLPTRCMPGRTASSSWNGNSPNFAFFSSTRFEEICGWLPGKNETSPVREFSRKSRFNVGTRLYEWKKRDRQWHCGNLFRHWMYMGRPRGRPINNRGNRDRFVPRVLEFRWDFAMWLDKSKLNFTSKPSRKA